MVDSRSDKRPVQYAQPFHSLGFHNYFIEFGYSARILIFDHECIDGELLFYLLLFGFVLCRNFQWNCAAAKPLSIPNEVVCAN